jgi:Fe2+ or Zn2+ uptake regulation protein
MEMRSSARPPDSDSPPTTAPRRTAPSGRAPAPTDDLVALLRARGQRVTSQRLLILRELRRRGRHATAEQIHAAVRKELPGVSVPTVYAVCDLLAELGLARKLDVGVGVCLYDARPEPHQHMVCRRCETVEDLDGELGTERLLGAAREQGFQPERADAVVHGLCARCARGELG